MPSGGARERRSRGGDTIVTTWMAYAAVAVAALAAADVFAKMATDGAVAFGVGHVVRCRTSVW
jgi:hypothetical protein